MMSDQPKSNHSGAMVALYPPSDVAELLAITDGLPPKDLHVTLAFLGDAAELDNELVVSVVTKWAKEQPTNLEPVVSGAGWWDTPDGPCIYRPVDGEGLYSFRESLAGRLREVGVEVADNHPWAPHIAVSYAKSDEERDAALSAASESSGQSWIIESVRVVVADSPTEIKLGDVMEPEVDETSIEESSYNKFALERLTSQGSITAAGDVMAPVKFNIPVVIPEGVESGDGRMCMPGSLSMRDMPLALMWQMISDDGHKQSVIVGRIDHVEVIESGGLGNCHGVFDTGIYAQEALRMVRAGMLRGISADLDMFTAQQVAPDEASAELITATKMQITAARLMGATLVAKPAFAECVITLVDGEDEIVPDGVYSEGNDEAVVAALVAAAAPILPPKAWFQNPGLTKPTHLTVDDDGRVYGHIAAWDVHHIGLPYGTRPPRSASKYAYFCTGSLRTEEGEDVRVGQLTLWGGHADITFNARKAVQHYDDTNSAVADLSAGEDQFGIWVSGALRPGVTPEQVRALRASSPSGDWRPIKGTLELVGVCQVNVPGFPIAQTMVAGGMVQALVAAGIQPLIAEKKERELGLTDKIDRIEASLISLHSERAKAALDRMRPSLNARQAALTASADDAAARLTAVRAARNEVLNSRAEAAAASVAALRVKYDFDEKRHPRDETGKFRKKLAELKAKLSEEAGVAAEEALIKLGDAADLDESGSTSEADKAAEEAADALTDAADGATEVVKDELIQAAEEIRSEVATLKQEVAEEADPTFEQLPQAMKTLLLNEVEQREKNPDFDTEDALYKKVKDYIAGIGELTPVEILQFLKN